ncbi:MAG: hypothetical protein M2R45_01413 [Verrucomicrobia subdivision 3 bacterium]|nr:hypothetical protein [Limisphaerales bacterium]MCS1415972.1 hypothetical protein [Limisphaerales bacterium]
MSWLTAKECGRSSSDSGLRLRDRDINQVSIEHRANVPLTVTSEGLIPRLDLVSNIRTTVASGIWDGIKLFTAKPPCGFVKILPLIESGQLAFHLRLLPIAVPTPIF